jgi:hypothetical protein
MTAGPETAEKFTDNPELLEAEGEKGELTT